jgi:ADP-L-glycero-D-manno-heptose 6-epimerase
MDLSPKRVLVTGGAGFIGSALVWALNRAGCRRIVVTDRLASTEKWRNLAPLDFEDYLEADELLARVRGGGLGAFDIVFHMGANSSTLETDVAHLIANNVEYTKSLAAWALSRQIRFVYASSAATYGDGAHGMPDGVDRLDRFEPLNAYGWSKHLFDRYAHRHGMLERIVGLKFFNVFGPNEGHKGEMRSVVHKAFEQIRDTGRLCLFKSYRDDYRDGEQQRDFLYVKDAVAMTLHLATTPGASGLFNIGSGVAHTWIDLATAVFAALDLPPRIEFIDMPEELRTRYQYHTQADLGRLLATGYAKPVTPLARAVSDYVTNHLVPGEPLRPSST